MKTRGKLAAYNPVDTRSSPCSLVEALQQLNKSKGNEEKVRALKYIGFGALLDLELKKQSLSLAAWLLDHFDPNKCSIEFSDGRSIKITDVDVHRCIGIPLGKKTLVLKGQNDNKDVLQRWRSQYDKQYSNLRPSHVTSALLRGVDGGLEFVQNFMVLFDTTLVNIQKSGGVSQRLVRNIDNVDAVKGINWREYVLSSLIKAKLKFGEERKGSFGGSLLFLVLLYLDRVVHQGQRQVPRVMPVFIGWNDIMVSTREKSEMLCGGFGKGRIEAAMDVEWIEDTSVTKEVEPQFEPAAADRFSYSPTTRKRSILFSQTLLRLLPKLIILTAFTLHGWKNCIKKENLCLYGFPNENWEVNLPAEEVPPELLEPA